jgi:O-antigen/teichoic acid export membrane protein
MIPDGYTWHVMWLSVIFSLASANYQILLGQEKIKAFNIISVLQVIFLVLVLFFLLFIRDFRDVMAYVYGLYASYSLAFFLTLILLVPGLKPAGLKGTGNVVKEIFRYGSVMQAGNILQFLNYRLGYYFIDFFLGRAAVGIYNVGVQLSESIWLVSRSISMVQYTRISNEKNEDYAARLTLTLVKISFLLSLLSLVAVFALIILFFPLLFKPEFRPIHIVMAAGILVFSVSIVLSPYFSGLGKPRHNTIGAAIGIIFTALLGWLLIQRMGLAGGGLAATISYMASTSYQLVIFLRDTKFTFRDFLLRKDEMETALSEFRKFFSAGSVSGKGLTPQ